MFQRRRKCPFDNGILDGQRNFINIKDLKGGINGQYYAVCHVQVHQRNKKKKFM